MMARIVRPDHVRAKLAPVIEALRGIDGESTVYDSGLFEHAAGLLLLLEGVIEQLDTQPFEPEEAQDAPPRELVTAVGLRAFTLAMLIEGEVRLKQSVVDQYNRELAALKYSGATVGEVRKLERDAKAAAEIHRLNIIDLTDQKKLLETFLETRNPELLAGTNFDQSNQSDLESK